MARWMGRIGLALIVAVALWQVWRQVTKDGSQAPPGLNASSIAETKEQRQKRAATIRQEWDSQEFVTLGALSAKAIAEELRKPIDSGLLNLSNEQREALAAMLAAHLKARSSDTAEAYLQLAMSDETTRWITKSDEGDWRSLSQRYAYVEGAPPDSSMSAESLLEWVVKDQIREGFRLSAFSPTEKGLRVDAFSIRAKEQADAQLIQRLSSSEFSYWFENNGHAGIWLRRPDLSCEQIIQRDAKATIANVCMLVTTQDGHAFNWHTTWCWDPARRVWLCDRMARKGWHAYMYF